MDLSSHTVDHFRKKWYFHTATFFIAAILESPPIEEKKNKQKTKADFQIPQTRDDGVLRYQNRR